MRRDSSSHKEGATRLWSVSTSAFLGDQGRVKQVRCARVEWVPDEGLGQFRPREVEGSEFTLDADLVLLAMGFVGPGGTAPVEAVGVKKDGRGHIQRDGRHMTTVDGIFVAGDMQRGASLVVHAISDGMRTAQQVITYLNRNG
jgi:glutamate synthase (NADPH/NADH) small chain